uniref:Uncharacterized protein TCIL3000_8_1010 n=1 Tax=Trypanosoma congolense (strain IL3000) TaxID=1068625 RepID=G0UR81_TRYCI|nr:unnamed protein product [Trypanosoma congolense IL3000]
MRYAIITLRGLASSPPLSLFYFLSIFFLLPYVFPLVTSPWFITREQKSKREGQRMDSSPLLRRIVSCSPDAYCDDSAVVGQNGVLGDSPYESTVTWSTPAEFFHALFSRELAGGSDEGSSAARDDMPGLHLPVGEAEGISGVVTGAGPHVLQLTTDWVVAVPCSYDSDEGRSSTELHALKTNRLDFILRIWSKLTWRFVKQVAVPNIEISFFPSDLRREIMSGAANGSDVRHYEVQASIPIRLVVMPSLHKAKEGSTEREKSADDMLVDFSKTRLLHPQQLRVLIHDAVLSCVSINSTPPSDFCQTSGGVEGPNVSPPSSAMDGEPLCSADDSQQSHKDRPQILPRVFHAIPPSPVPVALSVSLLDAREDCSPSPSTATDEDTRGSTAATLVVHILVRTVQPRRSSSPHFDFQRIAMDSLAKLFPVRFTADCEFSVLLTNVNDDNVSCSSVLCSSPAIGENSRVLGQSLLVSEHQPPDSAQRSHNGGEKTHHNPYSPLGRDPMEAGDMGYSLTQSLAYYAPQYHPYWDGYVYDASGYDGSYDGSYYAESPYGGPNWSVPWTPIQPELEGWSLMGKELEVVERSENKMGAVEHEDEKEVIDITDTRQLLLECSESIAMCRRMELDLRHRIEKAHSFFVNIPRKCSGGTDMMSLRKKGPLGKNGLLTGATGYTEGRADALGLLGALIGVNIVYEEFPISALLDFAAVVCKARRKEGEDYDSTEKCINAAHSAMQKLDQDLRAMGVEAQCVYSDIRSACSVGSTLKGERKGKMDPRQLFLAAIKALHQDNQRADVSTLSLSANSVRSTGAVISLRLRKADSRIVNQSVEATSKKLVAARAWCSDRVSQFSFLRKLYEDILIPYLGTRVALCDDEEKRRIQLMVSGDLSKAILLEEQNSPMRGSGEDGTEEVGASGEVNDGPLKEQEQPHRRKPAVSRKTVKASHGKSRASVRGASTTRSVPENDVKVSAVPEQEAATDNTTESHTEKRRRRANNAPAVVVPPWTPLVVRPPPVVATNRRSSRVTPILRALRSLPLVSRCRRIVRRRPGLFIFVVAFMVLLLCACLVFFAIRA